MQKINVKDTTISIVKLNETDFISLTDVAKFKSDEPNAVIGNWLRNRNTIEYLGIWETLYNPDFTPLEFEGFRKEAGLNAFTMSPTKWVESTNAKGIVVKSGRYGGTYAHKDIAFKFASWISVEFELYFIKEFQRLKAEEQKQLGWSAKRELAKINQLICLSNMENLNAVFINDKLPQGERLEKLNKIAIQQMKVLENIDDRKLLVEGKGGK